MQAGAAAQGLEPMSPLRFGRNSIAGMRVLASAGMGLYNLLRQARQAD